MERYLGLVKLFVVIAAVAIVAGAGFLGWTLYQRHALRQGEPVVRTTAAPFEPTTTAPAEIRAQLALPRGAAVIDMRLDGDGALLLLRTVEGEEYLALIDPASGRRRSLIRIVPETP